MNDYVRYSNSLETAPGTKFLVLESVIDWTAKKYMDRFERYLTTEVLAGIMQLAWALIDGANFMLRQRRGLTALIAKKVSRLVTAHRVAHVLRLSILDSAKTTVRD